MRSTKTLTLLLLSLFILSLTAWAAADPHVGTWKFNPAKSKYSPGPAPKEITMKIEASGPDGIKLSQKGTDAAGKPMQVEFAGKCDGKDMAIKGSPDADTISCKKTDANTMTSTLKKGGKQTMSVTSVVSKDGKTRTSTFTGTDPKGGKVNNVVVYEKQ